MQLYFIMLSIFKASADITISTCRPDLFKLVILFFDAYKILQDCASYHHLGKVLSLFQRWLDLTLIIFRQRKGRIFLMHGALNICANFMLEAL